MSYEIKSGSGLGMKLAVYIIDQKFMHLFFIFLPLLKVIQGQLDNILKHRSVMRMKTVMKTAEKMESLSPSIL